MISLRGEPETAIRQFMADWISLLAAGAYHEAADRIDEPDSSGIQVDPATLERAVRSSVLGLSVHQQEKIRPSGVAPEVTIRELVGDLVYEAEYHLPAYRDWAALLITFRFRARNGHFAVALEGIR